MRRAAIGIGAGALAGLLLFASGAAADMYLNSAEAMCNGSDASVLWCDDFEDGTWVVTNCDTSGGENNTANDGWCGSIYTPPDPLNQNYARCGSKGAVGTNCAASKAVVAPTGMIAKHQFKGGASVSEFYLRYYYYADDGSFWNHEKMLGFGSSWNANEFGFLSSYFTSGIPHLGVVSDSSYWKSPNVSTFKMSPGQWHYIELHWKLNTPGSANGVYEMWADACGANGLGCTGSGTLRAKYTNVVFRTNSSTVNTIWLMNWSPTVSDGAVPPLSSGDRRYDQLVLATRRLGPMGGTSTTSPPPTAPAAPAAPVLLP